MTESKKTITKTYIPSRGIAHRTINNKTVLVDPSGNRLLTLNETGSFIFDSLDGSSDAEAIARKLEAAFRVDAQRALCDVNEFIADLNRRGLIEERSSRAEEER